MNVLLLNKDVPLTQEEFNNIIEQLEKDEDGIIEEIYAVSYSSFRKVEDAYDDYLEGVKFFGESDYDAFNYMGLKLSNEQYRQLKDNIYLLGFDNFI